MLARLCSVALIVTALFGLSGCDNTVEPIADTSGDAFAVFGFLDMRSDHQVIRVESLRPTILASGTSLVGVSVTTSNELTGQRVVWTDSAGVDEDGLPVTLFTASFRPEPGARYRLEVRGDGDAATTATTQIPEAPTFYTDPAVGDESSLSQRVYMQNLPGPPQGLSMNYTVVDIGQEIPVTIPVSYGDSGSSTSSGWALDVLLFSDRFVVMRGLNRDIGDQGIALRNLRLAVQVPSAEWNAPPESNIHRGHGFFGSVGYYTYQWRLDSQSVGVIGWLDEQHLD